ncbi:hypothetical protein [Christiangramia sabulilitoris]|uniref:Uncharacterized protein n=1 Tax=Christiangramia sabulilitoris TaxID=2583991 RepID=A0A550I2E5_9FLAO|nr:hypothetical protein [Christiangramia sabulilitoris]TRO65139.1 hypothetical protein FGM01_06950 [Christiangramia sabulilitoris]
MKFIYNYLAFAAIVAMLFTSCSKDENTTISNDPSVQSVDLTFGALLNDLSRKAEVNKEHFDNVPDCSDAEPAYVELEISYAGQSAESMGVITIDILSEGGDYFTDYSEKLKIPVPDGDEVDVTLKSFIVFDAEGNRIWIAPIAPDDNPDLYDGYVQDPLEFVFSVQDGTKPYIDVEVLCYDRRMANEYGYVFFDVVPEVIYPYCLFINYCDEDGRHFVANYSVDLYFGPDDTGIQLYDGISLDDVDDADYGIVAGNYYSDPLCLIVPGKPDALAANAPYLFLVIYPNDWDGNYGDIDNSPIEVQLSWNDVNGLLNADGTTNEYDHILIGECEGALSGDGSGGNGGGTECDPTNPLADCDDDGVDNGDDLCPDTPENTPVTSEGCADADEDGIADKDEKPGCINDPDANCGETNGPVACDLTIPAPDSGCSEYFLEGLDGFVQITQPAGEFPDPYFIVPEGGGDDDRIGSVTIQLSDDLYPVVTVILNEGFSADDYIIEVKDESGSDVTCENGISLPTPGGDEPDIFEEFSNLGNYDYSFFVRIQINACSAN